ncbi:MAG: hypothetical protein ACPK85_06820 [Methanosarcina sp.]
MKTKPQWVTIPQLTLIFCINVYWKFQAAISEKEAAFQACLLDFLHFTGE